MSVTDQQRAEWRELHRRSRTSERAAHEQPFCIECGATWPCATRTLLEALYAAESERDAFAATVDALNRDWQRAEAALGRVEALVGRALPDEIDDLWIRAADLTAALADPSPTDEESR